MRILAVPAHFPVYTVSKVSDTGDIVSKRRLRTLSQMLVEVYGYSKTFGRCTGCNEIAADLLREHCETCRVNWTDAGY